MKNDISNSEKRSKANRIYSFFFNLSKILLVSSIVVFLILPQLGKVIPYKEIAKVTDLNVLLGLTCLVIFILFISWKWSNNFWRRYKNTYKSGNLVFTLLDYMFSSIIFSILIILIKFKLNIEISNEIITFLFVNLYLLAVYFISGYLWKKTEEEQPALLRQDASDTSDEPIKYFDEDLLNRKKFVKGLFDEIKELNSPDSFVFGLYGKWGDGKSSVLNLLRIILQRDNSFIVMNFEPWNFKDDEAILKAFFNTMEKAISKDYVFPNLRKVLFKYQKLIASGLSNIGLNIDLGLEAETIDEVKEKIEKYIKKTGKKLLIIIDEIDRLEAEETRMIFKLVRSNSKFKGTVFLLSLDKEKTTEKLDNGNEFLEKIIQKPIPLPKVEHIYVDKFVLFSDHKIPQYTLSEVKNLNPDTIISTFGYVTKIQKNGIFITDPNEDSKEHIFIRFREVVKAKLKINDKVFVEGVYKNNKISLDDPNARLLSFKLSRIDILLERMWRERKISLEQIAKFDKEISYLYRSQITYLIENFRDAKLFLNSLYSSYPAIAEEVDPFDFICLELLKVFAKDIYDDIYDHWWFYVSQRQENDSLNSPFTFLLTSEENKKRDSTTENLDKLIKNSEKLDDNRKRVIYSILEKLFPYMGRKESISDESRTNKRIHTTSFLKYFTLSVPSTELSDVFFEKVIKDWKENPNEEVIKTAFLKLQEQGKLIEFLDKLRSIYIESIPEDILKIMIQAIANNIQNFSKRKNGDLWDSEYERAIMFVLRALNMRINKKEIQSEIVKLINSTSDFIFAVDLVLLTKKERDGDLFSIYEHTNNLQNRAIVASRLEKHYINNENNVIDEYPNTNFAWIRILYQWSSNWGDMNSPYKQKVGEYLVKLFDNKPVRLIEFLKTFNAGSFENEWGMNYSEYSIVYDLNPLAELVRKFLNEETLSEEEREIFSKFVSIVEKNNNK